MGRWPLLGALGDLSGQRWRFGHNASRSRVEIAEAACGQIAGLCVAGCVAQVQRGRLLHGDDDGLGRRVACATVAVDGIGVEVDGIAGFEVVIRLTVTYVEVAGENVEELAAKVLVGTSFLAKLKWEKFGEVGVELAVWDKVAKALEEVGGVFHAGLGQADTILLAVNPEEGLWLWIKEVAEVFGEHHGDAGEISQGGHDPASLQLGEEAGGEAGVAAKLDETHGLFEAQVFDALADALLDDEGFGSLGVDLDGGGVRIEGFGEGGGVEDEQLRGGGNGRVESCFSHDYVYLINRCSNRIKSFRFFSIIFWNFVGLLQTAENARLRRMTRHGQIGNAVCCKDLQLGCILVGRRSGGLLPVLFGLLLTQGLGCASPGPPRPPSLKLPQPVGNLTAERIGDQVVLHWTTPAKTTDGLPVRGEMTAEICRQVGLVRVKTTAATAAKPSGCVPVQRLTVHAGVSGATDVLTGPLAADPVQLLAYTVVIDNAMGHAAGGSNAAYAASGLAAAVVEDLRATAKRNGAMIEWRQRPTTVEVAVELKRVRVVQTAVGAKPTESKAGEGKNSESKSKPTAEEQPDEVLLRAGQPRLGSETQQMAGTVDATAKMGESYRYTAQRVRTVEVAGQRLEMRSVASSPVTLVMQDIFPPSAPTGLAAIPGTGSAAGSARASTDHGSIDLSWEPLTDADLAGYVVYRQRVGDTGGLVGPVERLTEKLVVGPGFSDLTAVPGQRYAYRVTAVDHAGNESSASADVQEELHAP